MTLLRYIVLLQFTATLALGQPAYKGKPPGVPKRPEVMVRSLYREVIAHHPIGIPVGAKMKVFAPYLSKALLHRIDFYPQVAMVLAGLDTASSETT